MVESVAPLAGIEIGASDSPVKIAVVPPDFDTLTPKTELAPAATIQTLQIYSNLKPKMDEFGDFNRVFQQSEVDRVPTVLHRPNPPIPSSIRNSASLLRVTVLIVVDATGLPTSVRVFKPSGNLEFDAIITKSVLEDWVFTPAIKKGKKVKCLIQQAISVRMSSGSPLLL